MSKDRAAPFSRKHRKYWFTVTGGMLLIGLVNVVIGVCTYEEPKAPERIELVLPSRDEPAPAPGTLGIKEIPGAVMRSFAVKYPKTIPTGALVDAGNVIVLFPPGAAFKRATFREDGTFVADE